ncbi:MAG: cytochrome c biogenesis protein CcsA [uncultured bacterium]|nr:MAG: cytochrome c biogenesis protein CcsA [uncultured bacterium]HBY02674.1 cytochrome C assembly protein [Rikenellaceae bacterium]
MSWNEFIYFAAGSLVLWYGGTLLLYKSNKALWGNLLIVAGLLLFSAFIGLLWASMDHPPLRTMGETRLWYSLFIVLVGYVTYLRWRYKWLMAYSVVVSTVFVLVNLLKPEIHTTNLMPALQSIWFVPHVTVYILSYAMMGAATLAAIITLLRDEGKEGELFTLIDNLIFIGFGFLIAGMLMGAIWAKEAWGDYWTWDPKEVWAFITAASYLVYLHASYAGISRRKALLIIPLAFIMLMITWLGVEYLAVAQGSIHSY